MPDPDPIDVACPRCGAAEAAPCTQPNGRHLPRAKTHADRRRALEAALELVAFVAQHADDQGVPQWITTELGRDLYEHLIAELEQRDDLAVWTRMLVERIARNAEEAANARELAAESPLMLGSTGQSVAHPLWSVAVRLEERVLADLKALRMTPDSAGWVSGGAAEPKDELDELDDLATRRAAKGGR